jgi:competence protein ComEA
MGNMTQLPLDRRTLAAAAALLLVALALGGKLVSRHGGAAPKVPPPLGAVAAARPGAPAAAPVVVDVVGAVRSPGLYRLRQGARIADAVSRAGGATPKADLALVNLAAPLADGQQVVVPATTPTGAGGTAPSSGAPGAPAGPVHLNTATLEQLDALPGVGPVTAQKIFDYRQQHGSFSSVDELDAVPGIGPSRLDQLRDLVAP